MKDRPEHLRGELNDLGDVPAAEFRKQLHELADWVAKQTAHDRVDQARRELEARGLVA